MVTLNDVAERAGLSPMTASRVFSGRGTVSARSRERVLTAAAELGYVPNEAARSLRVARSNLVSLVVADIGNAFFAQFAKHAEKALTRAGYRVMIASSDEDQAVEADLLQGVAQMRADGLIIIPTPHNGGALEQMRRAGMAMVQVDRVAPGLDAPAILLDNEGATAEIVAHLCDHGYRRIVFISGPQSLTTGAERVAGALRAAADSVDSPGSAGRGDSAGSAALDLRVVEAESFLHEPAVAVVRRALTLHPDAIIAGNNVVLEACVDVLASDGIAIPDDVGLAGVDDLPWMAWVRPSLTAARQPVEEMARAAADVLLAQLSADAGDTQARPPGDRGSVVRLPAELMCRDSTAQRPTAPPTIDGAAVEPIADHPTERTQS
ncbi:LacI family transcriptional regulator [Kineosphaera limosa]|uniref:Putative LacI family transcriptional regulator n=1 Tax=Kineosphaera limosa NBRC 100340 TaxID=1184609 RepID=K6X9W1_9MICO|nr:LacI family DNA-binding transcriptional regulator [Kineosphaera limosa]NYD99669.1 LacI family transcriptional regulator [Kineosphaera limosa]GAB95624.1 putative LacI family transcriptional regulator [Kineosphaera limosa NBRC 100340]